MCNSFQKVTAKNVKYVLSISCLKTIYKKIKEYIGFMVRVTFSRTYLMSEQGILLACLAIENVVAS